MSGIKSRKGNATEEFARTLVNDKLLEAAHIILERELSNARPFGTYIVKHLNENREQILDALGSEVVSRLIDSIKGTTGEEFEKWMTEQYQTLTRLEDEVFRFKEKANLIIEEVRSQYVREVVIKKPDALPVNIGDTHYMFKDVFDSVMAGQDVFLTGASGSGKGYCARQIADALGLELYVKRCSIEDSSSKWFGHYQPHNGQYKWTPFLMGYVHGGVVFLDEFDAGNKEVMIEINGALTDGFVEIDGKMYERSKDCHIIAAANTWGKGANATYNARDKLDDSTMQRFAFIEYGYDEQLELRVAPIASWTHYVQAFRAEIEKDNVRFVVSPRASIEGGKMLAYGIDFEKVEKQRLFTNLDKHILDRISQRKRVLETRGIAYASISEARV